MNRRLLLNGAMAGVIGASLGRFALAARAAPPISLSMPAVTTRLNDKLSLITGVGGNVVALDAGDGLLLVDGGASQHTEALMAQLRALQGGGRVQTLFNTHWHLEQTGSNEAFGRAGATIIAHEKTKLWLGTDHYVPAEDRYDKARPKEAMPTQTFYTTGQIIVGAEHIEYGYLLEAHTDGDTYVFFRDSNVIAVGGAVASADDPELDWYAGGWLGGRVDSLALLLKLGNADTRFVAASGPVLTRAQVQAEYETLLLIFNRMVDMIRKGFTTQDMFGAGVLEGSARPWSDPQKFLHDAHKSIWAHHNTLSPDIV